jgi:hypothetical protein
MGCPSASTWSRVVLPLFKIKFKDKFVDNSLRDNSIYHLFPNPIITISNFLEKNRRRR